MNSKDVGECGENKSPGKNQSVKLVLDFSRL
jgi:hypothetical protein